MKTLTKLLLGPAFAGLLGGCASINSGVTQTDYFDFSNDGKEDTKCVTTLNFKEGTMLIRCETDHDYDRVVDRITESNQTRDFLKINNDCNADGRSEERRTYSIRNGKAYLLEEIYGIEAAPGSKKNCCRTVNTYERDSNELVTKITSKVYDHKNNPPTLNRIMTTEIERGIDKSIEAVKIKMDIKGDGKIEAAVRTYVSKRDYKNNIVKETVEIDYDVKNGIDGKNDCQIIFGYDDELALLFDGEGKEITTLPYGINFLMEVMNPPSVRNLEEILNRNAVKDIN